MSVSNLTTAYEVFVMLVAIVGMMHSIPLMMDEIKTRVFVISQKKNGRLLNTATELIWLTSIPPFVHAVLVVTCAYRVITPMNGHVIPSTTRLLLTVYIIMIVHKIKRNREKFPDAHKIVAIQAELIEKQAEEQAIRCLTEPGQS